MVVVCVSLLCGCPADKPAAVTPPVPGAKADPEQRAARNMAEVAAAKPDAVVVVTQEMLGWLEPCGCSDGQLGGVARRAAFLNRLVGQGFPKPVVVDGGDVLKEPGRQGELKLEALAQAYQRMGTAAVAVGETDLFVGLETIARALSSSGVALLATNLVPTSPQVVTPSGLVRRVVADTPAGQVAIEAFFDPAYRDQVEGLTGHSWTLSAIVREPRKLPTVVLYHGSLEQAQQAFANALGVVAVVSGHRLPRPSAPVRNDAGTLFVAGDDNGKHALVFGLNREAAGWRAELVRAAPLDDRVPDDPNVAAIYERYRERVLEENLFDVEVAKLPSSGGHYVGSSACTSCHAYQAKIFETMGHHKAYEVLDAKAKADPQCVLCHSTGFGYSSGFAGVERTPDLAMVGCESCHGPGSNHLINPQVGFGMVAKPQTLCTSCHDALNSPAFDYAEYWKRIDHRKR